MKLNENSSQWENLLQINLIVLMIFSTKSTAIYVERKDHCEVLN